MWMRDIENGTDAGLFGPGSAVWSVNSGMPTMIAGIRALLMQTLHPGAMAGVHDHSRYREDAMGRLEGTVRWVAVTTFGDRAAAKRSAQLVRRVHDGVNGRYVDASGVERPYSAHDPSLLRWVHDAFTDSFLSAHTIWGGTIPGGPDAYVREWAQSGEQLGAEGLPTTVAELREQLDGFAADFKPDARVAEAVHFLRRPGLPSGVRMVYPILFAGAVASLDKRYRRLLRLRRPWWPAITANRVLFAFLRVLAGPMSPSERAARDRIERLRATVPLAD